jgi:hypothetical protein
MRAPPRFSPLPLLPLQHDLDNFLCHSCAPNTNVVIGKDLAAGLVAKYPLTPGDAITFDYDQVRFGSRATPDPTPHIPASLSSRLPHFHDQPTSHPASLSPRLPHLPPRPQTEDDLRDLREKGGVDRGGFECNCGAEMCRGEILGRLFSPPLGAKKAAAAAAGAAVGAGAASSS